MANVIPIISSTNSNASKNNEEKINLNNNDTGASYNWVSYNWVYFLSSQTNLKKKSTHLHITGSNKG